VRAAIAGQGWLVATEVAGGWSTTFVPDSSATDPPDEGASASFQAAGLAFRPAATGDGHTTRAGSQERTKTVPVGAKHSRAHRDVPPVRARSTKKRGKE
jgi:hypothetical protein